MFKKIFGGGHGGGGGGSSSAAPKKVSNANSEKNTQNVINAIQQLQDVSPSIADPLYVFLIS